MEDERSHDRATRRKGKIDFFTLPLFLINRELPEGLRSATPAEAFRWGHRKEVRLCLTRGQEPADAYPDLPLSVAFAKHLGNINFGRLRVWCQIEADLPNGDRAIHGKRSGAVLTALDGAAPHIIADYAAFCPLPGPDCSCGRRCRRFKCGLSA